MKKLFFIFITVVFCLCLSAGAFAAELSPKLVAVDAYLEQNDPDKNGYDREWIFGGVHLIANWRIK